MADAPTPVALDDPAAPAWDQLLDDAIAGDGVRSVFQPIVDLRRLTVVGYESLTRFDIPDAPSPDRWFAAAASRGLVPELEAASLRSALALRPDLPPNCFLTINLEPESLAAPSVASLLLEHSPLGGLVVEITEHRPILHADAVRNAIERLRAGGALVAVDDAGSGYAGLTQLLELRPSLVKLDRALVAGVDRDEAKASLVEMIGVFAGRIDAWLLAEGVETVAEARRLSDLGIPLAQGYLFGRPAAPWTSIDPQVHAELAADRRERRSDTLHRLVEPSPWVADGDPIPDSTLDRAGSYVVLVDDLTRRPIGVMDAAARFDDVAIDPLVANVHTSPKELAHRLATRQPVDTSTPVVVVDNAGRYLGTVSIARLFVELAGPVPTSRRR